MKSDSAARAVSPNMKRVALPRIMYSAGRV
jgi:hypothetical protein